MNAGDPSCCLIASLVPPPEVQTPGVYQTRETSQFDPSGRRKIDQHLLVWGPLLKLNGTSKPLLIALSGKELLDLRCLDGSPLPLTRFKQWPDGLVYAQFGLYAEKPTMLVRRRKYLLVLGRLASASTSRTVR